MNARSDNYALTRQVVDPEFDSWCVADMHC